MRYGRPVPESIAGDFGFEDLGPLLRAQHESIKLIV
jgi:hypothetical protein